MSIEMITVSVQFFASARELTGEKVISVPIPSGSTWLDLKSSITRTYPALASRLDHFLIAINQDFIQENPILKQGDEVGIFPPVSGGSELPCITLVTDENLDLNALTARIQAPHIGAAVIFTGFVRGESPGTSHPMTTRLDYEAYQPMAEKMMRQICEEIRKKWPAVYGIFVVQRIGSLNPMEITTAIGVSTGHRDEGGFEAARYGIDRLKQIVPVWKKEISPSGEEWVEGTYRPGSSS